MLREMFEICRLDQMIRIDPDATNSLNIRIALGQKAEQQKS